jgi:hypothetical protein
MTESDPTKEPEFQRVVKAFLQTPPKPHKAKKRAKGRKAKAKPRPK